MNKEQMTDGRIDIYKWLKVTQCIILMLMGVVFTLTGILNKEEDVSSLILSISVGAVATVYGLMEILAGYLLYRSAIHKDVLIGEIILGVAVVLFIQHDVITRVLAYFFIVFFIIFAIVQILHGVDLIVGRHIKKSIPMAVSNFITAALMIGGDVCAIVYYSIDKANVEKYMLIIVGVLMVLFGLSSLVVSLKKISDTKKALKEQELQQQQMEFKPEEKEVKIINIEDLKKAPRKPKKNENKEETSDKEVKEITDSEKK